MHLYTTAVSSCKQNLSNKQASWLSGVVPSQKTTADQHLLRSAARFVPRLSPVIGDGMNFTATYATIAISPEVVACASAQTSPRSVPLSMLALTTQCLVSIGLEMSYGGGPLNKL